MKNHTPQKQQYKLRRVLATRKRDKADCISVGDSSECNLSTYSADAFACTSPRASDAFNQGANLQPIKLCNQQSYLSSAGSHHSGKKRRREFLDMAQDSESELVKFVLDTQGKLSKKNNDVVKALSQASYDETSQLGQRSTQSISSCGVNQTSRSVHRIYTDSSDQFGLQKRRMIEDFQGMSIRSNGYGGQQRKSPQKRQLIQVLNSVDFIGNHEGDTPSKNCSPRGHSATKKQRNKSLSARNSNKSDQHDLSQPHEIDFHAMSDIDSNDERLNGDNDGAECCAHQSSSGSLERVNLRFTLK